MRRLLPLLLLLPVTAVAQDRAYWWEGAPRPATAPYGLLLLGEARADQRQGAIRGFLTPLGIHDLPDGRSRVPLVVPVLLAGQAPNQTRTEWSDAQFLDRFWDAGRDAALRAELKLAGAGPLLVYRHPDGSLVADLSAAPAFWVRHWLLAYRRAVAAAPGPAALERELRAALPDAPVRISRR